MQEQDADRGYSEGTQGERYTAAERSLIEQMALRRVTAAEVRALFPERSVAAIKKQVVDARHRLGLIEQQEREDAREPTMLHPDDPGFDDGWEARQRRQAPALNQRFLAALMAAA